MIDREQAYQLLEDAGHLFNGSGDDLGVILRIYADEYTGWPSFATIASDQRDREKLVALHEASLYDPALGRAGGPPVAGVQVPYDQDRIDHAPTVRLDQDLTISEEDALFEYYEVPVEGASPVIDTLGHQLNPTTTTPRGTRPKRSSRG